MAQKKPYSIVKAQEIVTKPSRATVVVGKLCEDTDQLLRWDPGEKKFLFAWESSGDGKGTKDEPYESLEWEEVTWEDWLQGSPKDVREVLQGLLALLNATCPARKK